MSSGHLGQLGHLGDLGHLFHLVVKVIEVVSVIKVIEDIKVIDDRGHQGHRCHQCQQGHRGHQGQLCHLGHLFTKLPSYHSLVFNTTTNWLTNGRTTLGLSGLLLQYVYKAYRSASTNTCSLDVVRSNRSKGSVVLTGYQIHQTEHRI